MAMTAGCLTPAVRYTRPSRQSAEIRDGGEQKTESGRTPDTGGEIEPDSLNRIVRSYVGTPYRYGGTSRKGMDCSGFVVAVFRELKNVQLPHSSRALGRMGKMVGLSRTKPGDVVFFRGGVFRGNSHVGIVTGEGRFAHASSKVGVTYSSLDDEYYRKRFISVRRLF